MEQVIAFEITIMGLMEMNNDFFTFQSKYEILYLQYNEIDLLHKFDLFLFLVVLNEPRPLIWELRSPEITVVLSGLATTFCFRSSIKEESLEDGKRLGGKPIDDTISYSV